MYRLALALSLFVAVPAWAETVDVRYFGPVNVESYECHDIMRSSFINRVCYLDSTAHMVILLRDTYYAYCDFWPEEYAAFMDAPSMGRFYNANIKSDAVDGLYAC
jgi:hypothetical protein